MSARSDWADANWRSVSAYHEAGHALMFVLHRRSFLFVSLGAREDDSTPDLVGRVRSQQTLFPLHITGQLEADDSVMPFIRKDAEACLAAAVAGPVAELMRRVELGLTEEWERGDYYFSEFWEQQDSRDAATAVRFLRDTEDDDAVSEGVEAALHEAEGLWEQPAHWCVIAAIAARLEEAGIVHYDEVLEMVEAGR